MIYNKFAEPETNLLALLKAQDDAGIVFGKIDGVEPFKVLAAKTIYNVAGASGAITVNDDVGTFGDEATIPVITVNGLGQVTGVTSVPVSGTGASGTRAQHDLAGGTVLQANKDNYDTISGDVAYTLSAQSNGDVTNLYAVVQVESTIAFPGCRRDGSTALINALLVPAGNHELSFKVVNGEIWLADSVGDTTETPYEAETVVATPIFNVAAGTYNVTKNVTITCATSGATIYYTTNGSTPTTSSTSYSGPVAIATTATLKAIAVKSGLTNSAVQSAAYVIDTTAPTIVSWTISTNGTTHTVVFSEAVSYGVGGSGGFTAHMDGGDVVLSYVSGTGTTNHVFTGDRTVLSTEAETGSKGQYVQPGSGARDLATNALASVSGKTITNSSTQTSSFDPLVNLDSTLKFYYDAESEGLADGTLTDLHDQSSAGHDSYSAAGSINPTLKTAIAGANNKAVYRFNGSNAGVEVNIGTGVTAATINMVLKLTAGTQVFLTDAPSPTGLQFLTTGDGIAKMYAPLTSFGVDASAGFVLLTVVLSAGSADLYVNNSFFTTASTPGAFSNQYWWIGHRNSGEYAAMDLAHLSICDTDIGSDRSTFATYLKSRFGIA